MRFAVKWTVEDHSDAGVKEVAAGQVIKNAADATAMQALIDTDLMPALKSCYPELTEHSTRQYHATFEPAGYNQ